METEISNQQWIQDQLNKHFDQGSYALKDQRGDDQHFRLLMDPIHFQGLTLLQSHRKIHGILDSMRQGRIHALSIDFLSQDPA